MENKKKKIAGFISLVVASVVFGIYQAFSPIITDITAETLKKTLGTYTASKINTQLDKTHFLMDLNKGEENELAMQLGAELLEQAGNIQIECLRNETQDECLERNKPEIYERIGLNKLMAELEKFNQDNESCHDEVAHNANIDLSHHEIVFNEKIKCLLINKKQHKMLEQMAKHIPYLADTIQEINQQISSSIQ